RGSDGRSPEGGAEGQRPDQGPNRSPQGMGNSSQEPGQATWSSTGNEQLMSKKETNGADILRDVGTALFSNSPDWQARLAKDMDVSRETIRGWQRDQSPLNDPHSPIFDDLLELADRRIEELINARNRMLVWLRENRK